MNEIRTVEGFLANHRAAVVIAITDSATGARVHVLPCNHVKAEYFRVKVVVGRNKNGRYYVCDSVGEAEQRLGARPCTCVPVGVAITRDGPIGRATPTHPGAARPAPGGVPAPCTSVQAALISYFSSPDILGASLAMGQLDAGVLHSPPELSDLLRENGLGEYSSTAISEAVSTGRLDVRCDAGRGSQNRIIPIVEWGANHLGLNTEANCREVLAQTLRTRGFLTAFEFSDSPDTARCVAVDQDPIRRVRTAPNQRDLLAIRDEAEQRIVWAVETKGHSGLESWDFWELFGQLSRLEAWASAVRQEASRAGRTVLVNVAIAVPDRRCQAATTSCYARELALLRQYLGEPDRIPQIAQKTMTRFVDWWARWSGPRGESRSPNVLLVRGIGDVQGAPS